MAEHGFLFHDELAHRIALGLKTVTRRPITKGNSMPDGERWSKRGSFWGGWSDLDWSRTTIDGAGTNDGYIKVGFKKNDGAIARLRCTVVSADSIVVRECWRVSNARILGGGRTCEFTVAFRDAATRTLELPGSAKPIGLPSEKWRPSLLMPRVVARSVRLVLSVHPEQLSQLDQAEAEAEGFDSPGDFADGWDAAYAAKGMAVIDRPLVWAIRFAERGMPEGETR